MKNSNFHLGKRFKISDIISFTGVDRHERKHDSIW